MPLVNTFVQITDPGAVGAGNLWSNPSTEPPTVQVRNKTNTGWDTVGGGGGGGGTPALTLSTTNAAGVATTFIRDDDTILVFDGTVPVTQNYNDVAATGAATVSARRDHKHGMPASGGASGGTPALTLGTANSAGVAGTFIRDDDTILAFDATVPVTQAFSDAAATGAATVSARRDHKHGMPANPTPAFATPAIALGTAAAAGAASTVIRSDSTIVAFDATVPVTQAFGDSAATGAATVTARRDHKHGMPNVGTGLIQDIIFVIDGGGSVLTTGVKGFIPVDFACTIVQAELLADQTGSVVVNVWKVAYASFPPTVSNKITASAPPTITTAQKAQDATLTGWTTSIAAGDVIAFNVDSVTTIQRVTIALKVQRT